MARALAFPSRHAPESGNFRCHDPPCFEPCIQLRACHPRCVAACANHMDVAVTELRAHLGEWLKKAQSGDEIVVLRQLLPWPTSAVLRTAVVYFDSSALIKLLMSEDGSELADDVCRTLRVRNSVSNRWRSTRTRRKGPAGAFGKISAWEVSTFCTARKWFTSSPSPASRSRRVLR
jgi:hypothetical protein